MFYSCSSVKLCESHRIKLFSQFCDSLGRDRAGADLLIPIVSHALRKTAPDQPANSRHMTDDIAFHISMAQFAGKRECRAEVP
jgi:hypothetical protein